MKEAFFIDSSFFFALVDKSNQSHPRVKKLYQQLAPSCLTTNYVFAETLSLITKRLGKHVGVVFAKGIQASRQIELIAVGRRQEQQALEMYKRYQDKDFDYIDAMSFVLCREFAIQRVLTFDHHFIQMGFECLPGGDE